MLKYILIIVFVLLAIGGFALALVSILKSEPEQPAVTTPANQYPTGSPAQNVTVPIAQDLMQISTKDGSMIHVRDVRKDAIEKGFDVDVDGGMYYTLVTSPTQNPADDKGYIVAFIEKSETFNITVVEEPFEQKQNYNTQIWHLQKVLPVKQRQGPGRETILF